MLSIFDKLIPSSEAIEFQINNQLGPAIEALCQNVMDFRDDLINNHNYQYDPNLIDQVYRYIDKINFSGKLHGVIKKYANLDIRRIHMHMHIDYGTDAVYGVNYTHEDVRNNLGYNTEFYKENMITGLSNVLKSKNYNVIDNLMEFSDLSSAVDLNQSFLKTNIFGNNQIFIVKQLFFDTNTSFLSDCFTTRAAKNKSLSPNIQDSSKLNAKEITSILLHEIGHVFLILERSGEFIHQHIRINEILKYILKYGEPKEILKAYVKNADKLKENINKKFKNKGIILNKNIDIVTKASTFLLEQHENMLQSEIGQEGLTDYIINVYRSLKDTFKSQSKKCIELGMGVGASGIIAIIWVWQVVSNLVMTIDLLEQPARTTQKTSDVQVTHRNWFMIEREADNFAVRHGYGLHLAEALRKISLIANNNSIFWSDTPSIRNSLLLQIVYSILGQIGGLLTLGSVFTKLIYEDDVLTGDVVRIDRIIENTLAAFKDPDIPLSIKEAYVEDIKKLKESRAQLKKQHLKEQGLLNILNILSFLTFVPTTKFLHLLLSGHITKDYEKLQNQLDRFMNNELFYQSVRINKLRK
jgi:hypothetical protein